MKYMLLMNGTRENFKSFGSMPPEDIQAHVRFMHELNRELRASGEYVDAQGLSGAEQARLVRAQSGGPPVVTDGPFPESKESSPATGCSSAGASNARSRSLPASRLRRDGAARR